MMGTKGSQDMALIKAKAAKMREIQTQQQKWSEEVALADAYDKYRDKDKIGFGGILLGAVCYPILICLLVVGAIISEEYYRWQIQKKDGIPITWFWIIKSVSTDFQYDEKRFLSKRKIEEDYTKCPEQFCIKGYAYRYHLNPYRNKQGEPSPIERFHAEEAALRADERAEGSVAVPAGNVSGQGKVKDSAFLD